MDRYAVMGTHVQHSLSPRIHSLFAGATGQDLQYGHVEAADEGEFERAVTEFFADENARGINITMPFRHDVCEPT